MFVLCLLSKEKEERELEEIDRDAIAHRLKQDVVSYIMHYNYFEEGLFVFWGGSCGLLGVGVTHTYWCVLCVCIQLEQAGRLQRKLADLVCTIATLLLFC